MKKLSIILLAVISIAACKSKPAPQKSTIYGRWNTSFKDGSKVLAVFRADGTHDYFINGKLFSNGKFTIENNQLSEADPICNADYYAKYTVTFLSENEMQFTVIEDTCKPRIHDLDGIKMQREQSTVVLGY